MTPLTAERLIEELGLAPLPIEGGYFRETYRAQLRQSFAGYPALRACSTAIYYLLTPATCSRFHRLRGDEVYHFYLGDPVELALVDERGGRVVVLGPEVLGGMALQQVVPARTWQGLRLAPGAVRQGFALLGTTMAPGFELDDFELGDRAALLAAWSDGEALVRALTSEDRGPT